jgi:uncharacterized membrane protein
MLPGPSPSRPGRTRLTPRGPLEWLRALFLCLVAAAALFNGALIALDGAAWSVRLPALVALAGLVGWWVVGYRRGSFPALGAPVEALGLAFVSAATIEGQRAVGLIFAALLLRTAYGPFPAVALAVTAHLAAFLGGLLLAPPAAGNNLALGAAVAVGAFAVGIAAPTVVNALGIYERALSDQVEVRRRERQETILAAEGRPTTRVECVATFGRPIDELFDYVADLANAPTWQSWLVSAAVEPPGPAAVGTVVTEVRRLLGTQLRYTYRISELEPNRRIALESVDGPVPFSARVDFESVGQGSLMRVDVDVRTAPLARLFGPVHAVVGRMAERELQANLANLNDLLYVASLKD